MRPARVAYSNKTCHALPTVRMRTCGRRGPTGLATQPYLGWLVQMRPADDIGQGRHAGIHEGGLCGAEPPIAGAGATCLAVA